MARMVRVTLLSLPAHAWWWRGHALPLLPCPHAWLRRAMREATYPVLAPGARGRQPDRRSNGRPVKLRSGGSERVSRLVVRSRGWCAWLACGGVGACSVGRSCGRGFGLVWRGGAGCGWSRARVCAWRCVGGLVVRLGDVVWCSGRVSCPWRGRCGPGLVVRVGPVPQHFPIYSHVSLDIPV
jgi:hypothetical protein